MNNEKQTIHEFDLKIIHEYFSNTERQGPGSPEETLKGEKRIPDNALVALTLMIAVSQPNEKETMIKVIVNLINKKNYPANTDGIIHKLVMPARLRSFSRARRDSFPALPSTRDGVPAPNARGARMLASGNAYSALQPCSSLKQPTGLYKNAQPSAGRYA